MVVHYSHVWEHKILFRCEEFCGLITSSSFLDFLAAYRTENTKVSFGAIRGQKMKENHCRLNGGDPIGNEDEDQGNHIKS